MAKKKDTGISTMQEAVNALTGAERLKNEAEALMVMHGIQEKLDAADALKKAVTAWAVETDTERIDMPDGRYYGLRRDKMNKRVIGTDDDLAKVKNPTANVIPLQKVIRKKFGLKKIGGKMQWKVVWNAVTTRHVDPEKLGRVIASGTLTIDEVAQSYYEDEKAPFIRTY